MIKLDGDGSYMNENDDGEGQNVLFGTHFTRVCYMVT